MGSGIAGLSVAYELAKAGKEVVVLDRGPIGKGMTSRTTAHLTAQCDDRFDQLISRRGEEIGKIPKVSCRSPPNQRMCSGHRRAV
jgi:glycine/D-amino acid oxidase-like deaminating enzyme